MGVEFWVEFGSFRVFLSFIYCGVVLGVGRLLGRVGEGMWGVGLVFVVGCYFLVVFFGCVRVGGLGEGEVVVGE